MKIYQIIDKAKYILFATLMQVVAGCAIPKTVPLETGETQAVFRNDSASAQAESIATLPWKELLANKDLEALVDTALLKNNDLQIAIKDIEAADEFYKKSRQGYLPQVAASVISSNSLPSKNSLNGLTASEFLGAKNLDNYNLSLGISWEADIWGKVKNAKKAALAQYLQTQEARKGIQTMLISSISSGYYNLLMLDEQLLIARKNLALNDSTLTMMMLQFQSGQISSLATDQQEALKLAAAELIPKLEQQVNIQENALSILTGVAPGFISRSSTLPELKVSDRLAAGLPSKMISHRPDVRSRELELQVASARIGIATANMYPSLIISASGGVNSLRLSNWFNLPASIFGIVAGGLTQPILQKRELKTQYNLSVIQREQSVLRFRQSVLIAYQEVSDALIKIDKLEKRQVIASMKVSKLQKATANAGLLFANGKANYLEVITAQSNVLSGELELVSVKRDQLSAVVDLYRSLGGGWK